MPSRFTQSSCTREWSGALYSTRLQRHVEAAAARCCHQFVNRRGEGQLWERGTRFRWAWWPAVVGGVRGWSHAPLRSHRRRPAAASGSCLR
jgi:hypothetical protein